MSFVIGPIELAAANPKLVHPYPSPALLHLRVPYGSVAALQLSGVGPT